MPTSPFPLINTFLGTSNGANCLPGPHTPFGLVRLGPESAAPQSTHGYVEGAAIIRFAHTHVAGTGGASRYGNIGITPFTGRPRLSEAPPYVMAPIQDGEMFAPHNEHGSIGYYHVEVPRAGFIAELTSTPHVGVHRYTFINDAPAWILLDAGAVLDTGLASNGQVRDCEEWDFEGACVGGFLERVSATVFIGRGDFRGGWGQPKPYSIHFVVRFSSPIQSSVARYLRFEGEFRDGATLHFPDLRIALGFGDLRKLELKVGISFTSIAQAREDLEAEASALSFEECRKSNEEAWLPILSNFAVEGGEEDHRILFSSLVYRMFCLPTDLGTDKNNPLWKSGRRAFTDFYCLWDSIRNANTFFLLFFPEQARDMANALLDIADHQGWLPDAHIAHYPAYMQSACAADILFSEYALKGLDGIDYQKALSYSRKNAEAPSPDPIVVGRYLEDFNELGYLSTRVSKGSVSRMIEYCYHDWCIGRLAAHLGEQEVATDYDARSRKIWNLWREDLQVFAPRRPDGTWHEPFDPHRTIKDSWNDPFAYEGSCFAWTFNILHQLPELVRRFGGVEAFMAKLDFAFAEKHFHVKEIHMHMPHLYTLLGRPDLGGKRVLESLKEFQNASSGIPDNEDMGCQSGYFLFNSMGIYPIYGQDLYLLTPPLFEFVSARLGTSGKTLRIESDRSHGGDYIVSAKLNGEPLDRAWLRHAELQNAVISLTLSDQAGSWGRSQVPLD